MCDEIWQPIFQSMPHWCVIHPKNITVFIANPHKPLYQLSYFLLNALPVDVAGIIDGVCGWAVFD